MSAQPKSLFEATAAPAPLGWYELHIPLAKIDETPGHNPRKDYGEDDGSFAALVDSIRERGMQQYPRLWPVADLGGNWDPCECRFTIVSGHRRIAAARALGWESVRVCVPDAEGAALAGYTEGDKLIDALAENLQRKDLNCIEVAEGIGRLEAYGRTQEQIAKLIGKSQGRVSRTVRLLELPAGVRALLREGALYPSVAEEMLPLVGSGLMEGEIWAIAHKAIGSKLTAEGMATLVRHKLAAIGQGQTELFGANNSTATKEAKPEGEEPKGLERQQLPSSIDKEPAPTPKETNGLTRGESDKQFAEAMAPDPDVIPLSERPSAPAQLPTPEPAQLPASAPVMHVAVSGLGAEALLALAESENYKGHDLTDIVGAILVRRAVELELIANPAKATETEAKATKTTLEPEAEMAIEYANVGYCYPQDEVWKGGGDCENGDGEPAYFDFLGEAREFARQQSIINARFLIQVTLKTVKGGIRGDLWYFRGQQVPGGASNSVPWPQYLAEVGCVLEELCKEASAC